MNVYEKLQKCRVELQNTELKKSGNNKFAGYKYFELGDFLPTINRLCMENKLLTVTTFTNELATLEVINAEAPEEKVIFTSPQGQTQLKGCHEIQNIGAVETYQRRYLMMLAFEIVESDVLDSVTGGDSKKSAKQEIVLTDDQVKELYKAAGEKQVSSLVVDKQVQKKFGCKVQELSKPQYLLVLNGYKNMEVKEGK